MENNNLPKLHKYSLYPQSREEGASNLSPTFSSPPSRAKAWKSIAIMAVLLLVIIGGFYAYDKYQDRLQEVYNQGAYEGQMNYIMQQQQTGEVTFATNASGEWVLETTTFTEICGGGA